MSTNTTSLPRGGSGKTGRVRLRYIMLVFLLALVAGGIFYLESRQRPLITAIDPFLGEPGAVVHVRGNKFGETQGESRLEIAGVSPTASSYLSWNDTAIEVRLPLIVDSGLVYIVTGHGRSNPRLYMNRERLPVSPSGATASKTGPVIDSISSSSGFVGSVLTINGINFGANRNEGRVFFSWLAQSGFIATQEQAGQGFVAVNDQDFGYELWSDKEIRVRVPDGAVSGALYVRTDKSSSNYQFFQLMEMAGEKIYRNKATYSISYFVSISRVKAVIPNDLYLWIPRPLETAGQREVLVLKQSMPPLIPDYRGVSLYLLKDIQNGESRTISQNYLVQVYEVTTDIQAEKLKEASAPASALYAAYTQADAHVPSTNARILLWAKELAGREKNPHKVAKALYDGLIQALRFSPDTLPATPMVALENKMGDAYSMAMLYCALLRASGIPALPVSGYLMGTDRTTQRHYWVEYYLNGFGWVPVDPALGSGAKLANFVPPFEDRSRYFGNMDNKHLAFSRGVTMLSPMTPDGKQVANKRQYSLQNLFEEASGGLSGYSAFWSDIEVTGVY